MKKDKNIVEIRYYRRKYTNLVSAWGYNEEGYERDIDMDYGLWIAPTMRVEITKEQFEDCHAGKIDLREPFPEVKPELLEGLTDTQGQDLKIGDWVRVDCGTLTFDVKVHINHRYRLVPFDTYGWHRVVKLNYTPLPVPEWKESILIKTRKPEEWPNELEEKMRVVDLKKEYAIRQREIFDHYGI